MGDEPICKVPGTTTPPPTTTRSARVNKACKDENWLGDDNCDPGNNNEGCGWDKFRGVSDCCKGPSAMKNCKDEKLCKCLDPKFRGKIPTTTKITKTTTKKATTKKPTTKKPTTKKPTPAITTKKAQVTPAKTSKNTEVKTVVEDAASRLPSTLWTAIICCALIFAAI